MEKNKKAGEDAGVSGTPAFFINGRMITQLQIDKRVSDGKIYIPSGLTAADVQVMKKDWRVIGQQKR